MRTGSLRKSFLSIKGIYYQAEVNGQDILWLVPYKFAQNAPIDVDYRIMRTFVDFYQVLLGFVMFRLYTMEGLVYPPKFDVLADSKGAGLRAFMLETKGVKLLEGGSSNGTPAIQGKDVTNQLKTLSDKIATISTNGATESSLPTANSDDDSAPPEQEFDSFPTALTTGDVLPQPDTASTATSGIFNNCTFFLSRETPRSPLEFLLRSFGCRRIGWDAVLGDGFFTDNERDPSITHQIVDRPPQQGPSGELQVVKGGRIPGRIYVQPQYVWDCVNTGKLIRPDAYAPGEVLPPHLSPWVKPGEGYDPTAPLPEEEELESEEEEEAEVEEGEEDEALNQDAAKSTSKQPQKKVVEESEDDETEYQGMTIDTALTDDEEDDEEDSEEEPEGETEPTKNRKKQKPISIPDDDQEDLSETELAARQHQAEIEAEALGKPLPIPKTRKAKLSTAEAKREREEAEEKDMAKIMMPRKKRKLYEKMVYGNKKREAEVKDLQDKRRKIEKEQKKTGRRRAEKV